MEDTTYHDDGTMTKVYQTLIDERFGLSANKVVDIVMALQNAGILFREVPRTTFEDLAGGYIKIGPYREPRLEDKLAVQYRCNRGGTDCSWALVVPTEDATTEETALQLTTHHALEH